MMRLVNEDLCPHAHNGAILALVALLLAGCNKEPPKAAEAKLAEVFFAYPTQQVVTEYEQFTGRTQAVNTVEIRARVTGYLDKVAFKEGSDVKAGELLFEIDPRSYKATAAASAATVAQSKSHYDRLDRQYTRSLRLVASKAISQEDFDQTVFDRAEAEATLKAAKANEEIAALNVSFTKVTAPISGRISRRLVDPGNLVRADETALTTIVSLDPMHAYFDVDERTVLRLRRLIQKGTIKSAREVEITVQIALADEEDYSLTGVINFSDNQIEATTGTLRVRAVIDNAKKMLSPGMFVRVRVPIGKPHPAMLVREEALGADQGQRFVYVIDSVGGKNIIAYRRVKVGLLIEGKRVIESGLQSKDRVVVTGLQRVRPKTEVNPKPAKPTPQLAAEPATPAPAVSTAETRKAEKQGAAN